jgi:lysophospholipase L1-like esterase
MKNYPVHAALSILTVVALLAVTRLLNPAIQGPDRSQFKGMVEFTPERTPLSPFVRKSDPEPVIIRHVTLQGRKFLLEDTGGALDHFYESLERTETQEKGAITRIVHYGDSPTTADLITGDVRSLLQKKFGDAGHGFILAAKPWAWYQHDRVALSGSGWLTWPASNFEVHDGLYGLGGASIAGSANANSRIVFQDPGHTHFEVSFLRQPDGGRLILTADGKLMGMVDTSGEAHTPGFASFDVPGGVSALDLRVEQGRVRLFGIIAEKPGPGVVYDSLGMNGASILVLSHMFNEKHWEEELRRRNPDLVIVNYGTNEADFTAFVDTQYAKELRETIRRIRSALPEAAVLVMSPMDRGHRIGLGEIETMPTIPRIVALQRRVAHETGCGFFDTFTAMGGAGTMARWYTAQPRLVSADLTHPYPAGAKVVAMVFAKEIGAGLNRYKLRQGRNTAGQAWGYQK